MIKEMLIEPFQEGEYIIGTILWIVTLVLAGCVIVLFYIGVDEIKWSMTDPIQVESSLIYREFHGSTLSTTAVPVVTGSGHVGIGVATTGSSAKHTTVWDLKDLGIVTSDLKQVFRYAKQKCTLLVKIRDERIRISGIINDR